MRPKTSMQIPNNKKSYKYLIIYQPKQNTFVNERGTVNYAEITSINRYYSRKVGHMVSLLINYMKEIGLYQSSMGSCEIIRAVVTLTIFCLKRIILYTLQQT